MKRPKERINQPFAPDMTWVYFETDCIECGGSGDGPSGGEGCWNCGGGGLIGVWQLSHVYDGRDHRFFSETVEAGSE